MSLCRFSEGDVYVYYHVDGGLECCACRLSKDRYFLRAKNEKEMIAHLEEHRRAGHIFPLDVFEELAEAS